MKIVCAVAVLTGIGTVWPAHGHHSDVGYDRQTVVAFEARVSRYVFRNPHITIVVETEDRRGQNVEWEIETVAKSNPPKDKPWYHVLVHEAAHMTYVAERNLEPDESVAPIMHPLLGDFFSRFESGRYVSDIRAN